MKSAAVLSLLLLALPAAARRPDPVEERFKAADEFIEKGSYEKAREQLDLALATFKEEDPRLVRYYERTGASWLREDKIPEARASFTAALKAAQRLKVTDDAGAKAYTGMGLCLRRENNDKYALKFFKRALAFRLDEGTKMFVDDQIREIEGSPPLPAR